MTEVESVPKTKLDIVEDENRIENSCENAREHVEVENHTAEREEHENSSENTSQKVENRNDSAEAPPPPKNPWTRHLKSNGEKGIKSKLLFTSTLALDSCFLTCLCIFVSEEPEKPTVVKAAKRKGKVSNWGV